MDKKAGWVAFFDILGYQNFLERNEPETAAEKIAEFIKKLKDFQNETFLRLFKEEMKPLVKTFAGNILYLVISDSILLSLEADKSKEQDYAYSRFVFLGYCCRLFKELFVYGLPVRGAIEYGEYILVENQMFVGRPIVHAYQLAMNLDLSACQVSDSVGDLPKEFKNDFYLNYSTPLRTGEEKELKLLTPFAIADNQEDQCVLGKITDLKQFIMRSFCAHNKMINREVQKKIINTEFFLRFCEFHRPK